MSETVSTTGVALLILDMINDLDFPGSELLAPKVPELAQRIAEFRDQADRLRIPVVYVNDNYGHWQSEKARLIDEIAQQPQSKAAADKLMPRPHDYFLLKPRFSAFYATNLPVLLPQLKVSRLVLAGVAADICVLFSAADAHMREYDLWVPGDLVESEDDDRTRWALEIIRNSMSAETRPAQELKLADWARIS